MRQWNIYPAIDLRGGRVVRLQQGDPDREQSYHSDPLEVARKWQAAGARWLHVVDLDAAFGEPDLLNQAALGRILSIGLEVQFGGGLRSLEALRQATDLGVSRVVLGTAAVEKPELVGEAILRLGSARVAVAIDTRVGRVRTRGWRVDTPITFGELGRRCADQGVRWLIHTSILRDGMGRGLAAGDSAALAEWTGLSVIASGGVRSLADVEGAYAAGLAGVIIGRALYDGHVSLAQALTVGRRKGAG